MDEATHKAMVRAISKGLFLTPETLPFPGGTPMWQCSRCKGFFCVGSAFPTTLTDADRLLCTGCKELGEERDAHTRTKERLMQMYNNLAPGTLVGAWPTAPKAGTTASQRVLELQALPFVRVRELALGTYKGQDGKPLLTFEETLDDREYVYGRVILHEIKEGMILKDSQAPKGSKTRAKKA